MDVDGLENRFDEEYFLCMLCTADEEREKATATRTTHKMVKALGRTGEEEEGGRER